MAKKESPSLKDIINDILNGKIAPIYFLMGEEPYFIDLITDTLEKNVLTEEEKDFNMTTIYGADSDIATVINASRRFPMLADKQLIIVKEAQMLSELDKLEFYTKSPSLSTVLVINYKYKKYDTRKKLIKDIQDKGIVFESKKIYEDKVPDFILSYIKPKGYSIDGKAALMLANYIGNNLSRLTGEIDKLIVRLGDNKKITSDIIEGNIGISKEYNNFELLKAIINKDLYKANLICSFFAKDPKNNPFVLTLSVLFSYFSNLMLAYYSKDKSENGLAQELNLRSSYAARDYLIGLKNYRAIKTMEIISLLRSYDAKSKGYEANNISENELLRELIFKITH